MCRCDGWPGGSHGHLRTFLSRRAEHQARAASPDRLEDGFETRWPVVQRPVTVAAAVTSYPGHCVVVSRTHADESRGVRSSGRDRQAKAGPSRAHGAPVDPQAGVGVRIHAQSTAILVAGRRSPLHGPKMTGWRPLRPDLPRKQRLRCLRQSLCVASAILRRVSLPMSAAPRLMASVRPSRVAPHRRAEYCVLGLGRVWMMPSTGRSVGWGRVRLATR